MSPVRIQRKRTKGWRMPEGAVYVGRGSRWGNTYKVGETLVRMPALDGGEWEHEGRSGKTPGEKHAFVHNSDGSHITFHQVEVATAEQCVLLFREAATGGGPHHRHDWHLSNVGPIRHFLQGKDLACWCPLDKPCHADVLLELANNGSKP